MPLDHARYCAEILTQTTAVRQNLPAADLTTRVPTCPDWTLRDLLTHLGGSHRWAAEIVRRRATDELPEEEVPAFTGPSGPRETGPTPGVTALDTWLAEGADLLVTALREAGPDVPVWSWSTRQEAGFWARRMTHETVIHRADVFATVSAPYDVAPEVAADCVDEWLSFVVEAAEEGDEDLDPLRARAGDSLHLHATDTPAEWMIELGTDAPAWRRAHGKATVALRGPLTDVLRVFYRRLPPDADGVEVLGDAGLLDLWLECTRWG